MNMTLSPSLTSGEISIPGSKSHTIRALLIATLAEGCSTLKEPLYSSDTLSCIDCCKQFGAKVLSQTENEIVIEGMAGNFPTEPFTVDVGNSGTSLYLAAAIASLSATPVTFTGDEQIKRRSAAPLLGALESLGAKVTSNNGCAPFTVQGPLVGGFATLECPTSQYLSALLLVAPLLPNSVTLKIPLLNELPYVQMTLNWLEQQGAVISHDKTFSSWETAPLNSGSYSHYLPITCQIPADFSSASFFLALAALNNSDLTLTGLDMNDTQGDKEIVHHLIKMGTNIKIGENSIKLKPRLPYQPLKGIDIDLNTMPDALPILATVGAFAQGTTRLCNVAHARLKETDRIACITTELQKLGFDCTETSDGLEIIGQPDHLHHQQKPGKSADPCQPILMEGYGDHRMVMSLAVAATVGDRPLNIATAESAAVTFPNFFKLLETITQKEFSNGK